jgi:hypothetical protein
MTSPVRPSGLLGLFLVTLLCACGRASHDGVKVCRDVSDCGEGAFCVRGSCQASSPPLATFTAPASPLTNRVETFTSTSSDPDPGDAVTAHAWSVTTLSAACDADAEGTDAAHLDVIFWCAGTYQVSLTVTDSVGVESAPRQETISVGLLPNAPSVGVGADVAVDHRCGGLPFQCALEQPVSLSAAGQSPAGGLTYQWSIFAPDATRLDASASLWPSATDPAVLLQLTTDGGPISGTWALRVRLTDAAGHLAQATQLVTVGNRTPVVSATALAFDHVYQSGLYRAGGPLSVTMTDPDGDLMVASVQLVEPTGSGCTASVAPSGVGAGTLSLTCPTAAGLAAAGRALHALATDVNGAAASADVTIQIRNRLPVVVPAAGAGVTELLLDHTVGTCPGGSGSCFLVSGADPFVAVDPDGDPLSPVTLTATVEAARTASVGETDLAGVPGTFRFSTPVERPAELRDVDGTSGFFVTGTVADPFGASAPTELAVRVGNRPPVVTLVGSPVSTGHTYDPVTKRYLAEAVLATVEDPDGDPLVLGATTGDARCAMVASGQSARASCFLAYDVATGGLPPLAAFRGNHSVSGQVGDGWTSTHVASTVVIGNTQAQAPAYAGPVEGCGCWCYRNGARSKSCTGDATWMADAAQAVFPVHAIDADGDPVEVFFQHGAFTVWQFTALPEQATTPATMPSYPDALLVRADDGTGRSFAFWEALSLVCSKQGQTCTP